MPFVPDTILIEEGLDESGVAVRAREACPAAQVTSFAGLSELAARLEALPVEEAKRRLVIARRAGGFVKEFPTGAGIRPSGWHYFIPAIGCPADCRYCFLQAYHAANAPVIFAEQDQLLAEIEAKARALGGGWFYGGELCDNLALERYLSIIPSLINLFRRLPEATLELRTKFDDVAPLMAAGSAPNVVISWTLAPDGAQRLLEEGTATIRDRIAAAAKVQAAGFKVGLRLDPIILMDGWREAYIQLVGEFAALDPEMVESVHLGALRFTPALKAAVCRRFGYAEPFCGEFVHCTDGKMRYPRPLRAAAYAAIARIFKSWSGEVKIRLCMETPDVEEDYSLLMPRAVEPARRRERCCNSGRLSR